MVLEMLNFRQNGQVDSKNTNLAVNLKEINEWFHTSPKLW